MEKFFKLIERVNTLAFFSAVVLAVCLLLCAAVGSIWSTKGRTSVVVPNEARKETEVLSLAAWEFIPDFGIQVLKLQSTDGKSVGYEGEGRTHQVRNLLFVGTGAQYSKWMLPDQSRALSRLESLSAQSGGSKAIYFESRAAGSDASKSFSVNLVKPDGTGPVEVLKDVTHLVSRRVSGDVVHFIYQSSLEIRQAKVSLRTFEPLGNSLVAKMVEVPR
jgi:hypothetical protein